MYRPTNELKQTFGYYARHGSHVLTVAFLILKMYLTV